MASVDAINKGNIKGNFKISSHLQCEQLFYNYMKGNFNISFQHEVILPGREYYGLKEVSFLLWFNAMYS